MKNMVKHRIPGLCLIGLLHLPGAVQAQPTVADFIRESDYRMAAISPNGQYLAEVWNKHEDGTRIVSVRDVGKPGAPVIGSLADRVVRPYAVSWANDERLLLHVSVPYETESVIKDSRKKADFDINDYFMFSRTVAVNADGSNPVVLLEDEKRLRRNVNLSRIRHFLPNDPRNILMVASRSGRLVQYKVDVYTGGSEEIVKGTRDTYAFLNDEDGKLLYRLDYKWVGRRIEIHEFMDGEWKLVEKVELDDDDVDEEADRGDFVGLYKDDLVYRKKNEETGFYELWRFNRGNGTYDSLVSLPDRDVVYPISSLRSNELVGYAVDGDLVRYRFFNEAYQLQYDKLADLVGPYNFSFRSFSSDGRKAIINQYGRDNPSSFSFYDFDTGNLSFLQNGYFAISTEHLSVPAKATFSARDGLLIPMHILLPKTFQQGTAYPLVVLPHGGPHVRERADYDDFAQFISTRGYIVVQPNFRGSTGFGRAFEEAGYKQWGGRMQDDLEDAVKFMVAKGYADPERVCIAGASYGGYAALMGVINAPQMYKCAVSINGVTDLPDMIEYDEKRIDEPELIQKYLYERMGHPQMELENLVAKSPARQAGRIQVPLLIVVGTGDEVVPIGQARKLIKALKNQGKEHTFLELEDAGHNPFQYSEDAEKVYQAVEQFLAKYLR